MAQLASQLPVNRSLQTSAQRRSARAPLNSFLTELIASLAVLQATCAACTAAAVPDADMINGAETETSPLALVFPCTDDRPYVIGGYDTGHMRCSEGAEHRARPATCAFPSSLNLPPNAPVPYGRCKTDADCEQGAVCDCRVDRNVDGTGSYGGGYCTSASCRTDDDCGAGLLCVLAAEHGFTLDGCPARGNRFVCETPQDECASYGDCSPQSCYTLHGHLACDYDYGACGG